MLSRVPPNGFIEPCLPSPADKPPTGPEWVHEILQAARIALSFRPDGDWLKFKNPDAPAVKREAEEDWGR